ncbi:MAG: hypothetical protein U0798_10590 [Gemmataceae bacterium]
MKFFAFLREILGWLLLVVGLVTFLLAAVQVLAEHAACSGLVLTGIGYVIFRGGLHLIKVAVAARAAAEGRGTLPTATPPRVVRKPVVAQASLAAPKPDVLPGPKTKRP